MSIYNDLADQNSPMLPKSVCLALLLFCGFPDVLWSQSGPGAVFRFLNVPVSPQASALGGGPVSLPAGDLGMIHINPAYLNQHREHTVFTSYSNYLGEVAFLSAGGVYTTSGSGNTALSVRYVQYGEFDRTSKTGAVEGSFQAYDMAIKLAYSHSIGTHLHYGLALDYVNARYDIWSSDAVYFSGGLILDFPDDDMTVGLSILNAGVTLRPFDAENEPAPTDIRLGVTRKLKYLPVRLSLTAHTLNRWEMRTYNDIAAPSFSQNVFRHTAIGGEVLFSRNVTFRLGYNHGLHEELKTDRRIDFSGFSSGVGIQIKTISFDVSRTSFSEIGRLFQIGIRTRI